MNAGRGEARRSVLLESTPEGLRAKQFGAVADAAYWDALWDGRRVDYGPAIRGHLPRQLRRTFGSRVAPSARVLEAGCGPAYFTVALRALGYEAVGLDWGSRTVERVRSQFPDIDVRHGDVRDSPFPDGYFDAVYSPGVCEHFEDGPDAVLADAYRVLRAGGLAFVSTPHLNALRRRRWQRHSGSPSHTAFYQYLFTSDGMKHTLERIGYEVIEITPYATWATFALEWSILGAVPLGRVAGAFDLVPGLRRLGSNCIWTARKPGPLASSR
jgi:SAM-dependent methyltransferase